MSMDFIGVQTSDRDVRAEMSEQPYSYITDFSPSGVCSKDALPYTCGFNEGGKAVSSHAIRVGAGLTRIRGGPKISSQMVGPVVFQHGNGAFSNAGYRRQVRRGASMPSIELKGSTPFQYGQHAHIGMSTTQRGRNKYEYAVQTKPLNHGPRESLKVEPFILGGVSTREGKDFGDC